MDLKTFTSKVRDGYQLAVIAQRLQQLYNTQQAILKQHALALEQAQQQGFHNKVQSQRQLTELTQACTNIELRLNHSQQQTQYWQQLLAQLDKMHQTSEGIKQLLQPLPLIIDKLNTQPFPTQPAALAQSNFSTATTKNLYIPKEIEERAFDGRTLSELSESITLADDSTRLYKAIEGLLIEQKKPQTSTDNAKLAGVMDSFYQRAESLADTLDYSQKDILLTQQKLMQLGTDFQNPESQQELEHLIVQAQALRVNPVDLIDHYSNVRPLLAHSEQPEVNAKTRAQYFDFISHTNKTAGIDVNMLNATLSSLQSLSPTNTLATGEAYDLISMSSRLSLAPNQFIPVTEHLYKAFNDEQHRATLRDQGVPEIALSSFSSFAQHLTELNAAGQRDNALNQLYTLLPPEQVNLLKATQPQAILNALPSYQQDYQGATERYAATERESISNDNKVLIRTLDNFITHQGEFSGVLESGAKVAALAVGAYGLYKVYKGAKDKSDGFRSNGKGLGSKLPNVGKGSRAQVFWLKRIYGVLVNGKCDPPDKCGPEPECEGKRKSKRKSKRKPGTSRRSNNPFRDRPQQGSDLTRSKFAKIISGSKKLYAELKGYVTRKARSIKNSPFADRLKQGADLARSKITGPNHPKPPALPVLKDKGEEGLTSKTKHLKHLNPMTRAVSLATNLPKIKQALQEPLTQDSSRMLGKEAGGLAGSVAGAAMGGTIGSIIPLVGTAVGALIGGIAGSFMGEDLGETIGEKAWDYTQKPDAADKTEDAAAPKHRQGLNPLGLNSVPLPTNLYPPETLTQTPLTPAAPTTVATQQQRVKPQSTFAPILNLSVTGDPDPKTVARLKDDCERWLSQQLQQLSQGSGMEFYDAYN